MEQNKLKPLLDWVAKNNQALLTTAIILVVVFLMAGIVIWNRMEEGRVAEETMENVFDTVAPSLSTENNVSQTAVISAMVESGKGEVVFMVSAKKDAIIREIQLHNPHKNSWVVVYDGYKPVFRIPVEVFRARLTAINYDMIQVRTLDSFYPFFKEVLVQDGKTITVNLDL